MDFATEVKSLVEESKKNTAALAAALKKQKEEIESKFGAVKEETAAEVKAAEDRLSETFKTLDGELKKSVSSVEELDKKINDFAQIKEWVEEFQKSGQRPDGEDWGPGGVKSAGELFSVSENVRVARESKSNSVTAVTMKSLFTAHQQASREKKASLLSTAATRLVMPQRLDLVGPPERVLRMRELIPVVPTTESSFEYVEETGFAATGSASGTQTHGAAAATAEGAALPEAQMEFDLRTANVRTLGHWLPMSRQLMNDDPALRTRVDRRLVYGVSFVEDSQIIYGDGTGSNLTGIATNANVQTYVESTDGAVGDTKIDSLRKAMTLSYVAEYFPTGLVLNPSDWQEIQLIKGTDGHYVWLSVGQGTDEVFFRLPVVVTNAINVGDALVGAFSLGATLYDREDANIRVAEQHEDFAVKGMVALIGEERVALVNERPQAFVYVTLDDAPAA